MTHWMKQAFRLTSGIFLVVLGLAGLALPILPGWIFLIPGMVILGDFFPPAKRLVEWAKRKAGWDKPTPPEPVLRDGSGPHNQ